MNKRVKRKQISYNKQVNIVKMRIIDRLLKRIQQCTYNLLITRYGLILIILSIIFILISILNFSDTLLEYRIEKLKFLNNKHLRLQFNNNNNNNNNNNENSLDSGEFFKLCDEPIDVVYTWVNGSDISHMEQLKQLKETLGKMHPPIHNTTIEQKQYQQLELDYYVKHIESNLDLNNNNKNETISNQNIENDRYEDVFNSWKSRFVCYYKLCIQDNNLFIIKPKLFNNHKLELLNEMRKKFGNGSLFTDLTIETVTTGSNDHSQNKNDSIELSLLHFNLNTKIELKTLIELNKLFQTTVTSKHYKIYLAYYTIDCSLSLNCIKDVNRTFILKKYESLSSSAIYNNIGNMQLRNVMRRQDNENNKQSAEIHLPKYINDNLFFKFGYLYKSPSLSNIITSSSTNTDKDKKQDNSNSITSLLGVIKVKSGEIYRNLSINFYSSNKTIASTVFNFINENNNETISYDLYKANIVWDLGDQFADDIAANRFHDNNELKYSLRSIEKYAPWVRNIFIVTNGQVPNWLNISHPRIRLITHDQIFPNPSHLPTFSSPAIESHLHRIPNISKHFIYFNDDVILGRKIWPDDFYTKSKGFKVYLAWQMPGCNEHCPNAWINDNYCDKACNTSACDFDGGDCLRPGSRNMNFNMVGSSFNRTLLNELFCSPGCTTTWLADRYCDSVCNVAKCGFDMGDCGVASYSQLHSVSLFGQSELERNKIKMYELDKLISGYSDKNSISLEWVIQLPKNLRFFYMNFTYTNENFTNYRMENASYEKSDKIRTISVVNKFRIMNVLFMESANASLEEQSKKHTIKLSFLLAFNQTNHGKRVINGTIIIKTNELDLVDTPTTARDATLKKPKLVEITSSLHQEKSSTITPTFKYAEPQKIEEIDEIPIKLNYTNVDFNNKVFNRIFSDYRGYLNWSRTNGYLSNFGYEYKLKLLYLKINEVISNKTITIDELNIEETLFDKNNNLLRKYDVDFLLDEYEKNNSVELSFRKRKLLDTYADSLRYVNRIYNNLYGFIARKVPAHMPHFIDISIMNEFQGKFREQFEKTSSNRLRSKDDMQFAFSYFYYLMSELEEFNMPKIFNKYDINMNKKLDSSELNLLGLRISDASKLENFDSLLRNCTALPLNEIKIQEITENEFLKCEKLSEFLNESYWIPLKQKKYKYETLGDEDVTFQMVGGGNDVAKFMSRLEQIMKESRKFICLNDNIDYKTNEANELKRLLQNFYSTLYPNPSTFEKFDINPNDVFSKEYISAKSNDDLYIQLMFIILSCAIIVTLFLCIFLKPLRNCSIFTRCYEIIYYNVIIKFIYKNDKVKKELKKYRRKKRSELIRNSRYKSNNSSSESETRSSINTNISNTNRKNVSNKNKKLYLL